MRGEAGRTSDDDDELFTDALGRLKEDGCALLLVGSVPDDANSRACRRMLGKSTTESRQRVLVFTDATRRDVDERLPAGHTHAAAANAAVVKHTPAARTAVSQSSAPSATGPSLDGLSERNVDGDDVSELGAAVVETVAELKGDRGTLDTAELRVCLDSLSPLLEAYDEADVFRFVHVLAHLVCTEDGIFHAHLPLEPSARMAHLFRPLFDAVVELRMCEGYPQQRWHLPVEDVDTDWLPL